MAQACQLCQTLFSKFQAGQIWSETRAFGHWILETLVAPALIVDRHILEVHTVGTQALEAPTLETSTGKFRDSRLGNTRFIRPDFCRFRKSDFDF